MHPTAIPRPLTVLALFVAMALAITLTPAIGTAQTDDPTPPPEAVVLARSDEPADALGAGPVAGILGAPVLLTPTAFLLDTTADALQAIDPDLVILAGGTVALSADVETAVNDLGYPTRRAAGSDRHETAALIAGLLAEFNTGRPLLSGAPITDDVIPGLNAERLDGMTLTDILAATEPADEIVLSHSTTGLVPNLLESPDNVRYLAAATRVNGDGIVHMALTGPQEVADTAYLLDTFEYCMRPAIVASNRATLTRVAISGTVNDDLSVLDDTVRDEAGCFSIEVGEFASAYSVSFRVDGTATQFLDISGARTTWTRVNALDEL